MLAAVASGRISAARVDSSVRRLLMLKTQAGLFDERTVPLERVQDVVGRASHQAVADDIARRSLTLVQRGPLDTFRVRPGRMAVITYAEETNLGIGNTLVHELRDAGDTVQMFRLYPASGPASYDSARAVIRGYPNTVFATSVHPIAWRGHVDLPDSLAALIRATASARPTVLLSFGSPYLLAQLPGFPGSFLIAWSDVDAAERAAAQALTGQTGIQGTLPITLDGAHPRGWGIRVP